jgi:hypothetical protein
MTTMKPIQINLRVTEPLQQTLRQAAANELSYARRGLVKVLRADGFYVPLDVAHKSTEGASRSQSLCRGAQSCGRCHRNHHHLKTKGRATRSAEDAKVTCTAIKGYCNEQFNFPGLR